MLPAKSIRAECDVLDVVVGTKCLAMFKGEEFTVKVLGRGKPIIQAALLTQLNQERNYILTAMHGVL